MRSAVVREGPSRHPGGGQDEDADQGYGDEGMNQETTAFMTVGGQTFAIALEDNETAAAFAGLLPLDVRMSELNGNEKYHYLLEELPSNDILPGVVHAGDVMLYSEDCLVVFYETFSTSYRYTPIGHVCDAEGLIEALGNGSADVSFSIAQSSSSDAAE